MYQKVSGDHKSAAQPRIPPGGDPAAEARHGGTVVPNTTALGHTSAARGRRQAGEPIGEASGLAGGDGIDRSAGNLRGRSAWGDRESEEETNRLGQLEEELGAELLTPAAATGTAGTGRGSPASARGRHGSRGSRGARGFGACGGELGCGRPTELVRLNRFLF